MKFSKYWLRELIDGKCPEIGGDIGEMVSNTIVGTRRWSLVHEIVFTFRDTFYQTEYKCAKTELQDEKPYAYDSSMIDCDEVKQVEVMCTKWEKVWGNKLL